MCLRPRCFFQRTLWGRRRLRGGPLGDARGLEAAGPREEAAAARAAPGRGPRVGPPRPPAPPAAAARADWLRRRAEVTPLSGARAPGKPRVSAGRRRAAPGPSAGLHPVPSQQK